MSVNLQKGQKVDLTKGNTGLKTILVGPQKVLAFLKARGYRLRRFRAADKRADRQAERSCGRRIFR